MSDGSHRHDTRAIVCSHVVDDDLPVCHVIHDGDGEWQFLCNGDDHASVATARIACLGCMRRQHVDVAPLIDTLPRKTVAWRPTVEAPWERFDDAG